MDFSRANGVIHRSYVKLTPRLSIWDFKSVKSASSNYASEIAPQFLFILLHVTFHLFCRLLLTTGQKRDCNTNRFTAKFNFAHCERQGFCYFIGCRLFEKTYSFGKGWHVYKSSFFWRESFLRENWPENSLIDKEQKGLANSFILNTFLEATSNAAVMRIFP